MLNMDFSQKVVIDSAQQNWGVSRHKGVWPSPLAREEAECGHATSLVKYDAGASFAAHDHPKGEKTGVLEGVLSDATGDYPVGSYCRNPEGFYHAPFSQQGCYPAGSWIRSPEMSRHTPYVEQETLILVKVGH